MDAAGAFVIERSLPHGHVEAALVMARRLGLARLFDRARRGSATWWWRWSAQRVLAPASKLASVRAYARRRSADELGVADADEDALYAALDWLVERQDAIERRLARRHLDGGEGVVRRVSLWFEGRLSARSAGLLAGWSSRHAAAGLRACL